MNKRLSIIPTPVQKEENSTASQPDTQRAGQSVPGFATVPSLQDIITAIPNTGDDTPQWAADIFMWLESHLG
jgi:hypothetical protein